MQLIIKLSKAWPALLFHKTRSSLTVRKVIFPVKLLSSDCEWIYKKYYCNSFLLTKDSSLGKPNKGLKNEGTDKPEKKKKEKLTYVTLIETDENVTVMTLEDATKLALRRNLKLIKVKDYESKSERSTYQLMTTAQYLAEEKKTKTKNSSSFIKGVKLLTLSSKIDNHDLQAKIKNIIKWLSRCNEVRIIISNVNGEAEAVFSKISCNVVDKGKVVQKRVKGMDLKFQIIPLKNKNDEITSLPGQSLQKNAGS